MLVRVEQRMVCLRGGPEPWRLPLEELTRRQEGEIAYFLVFAGSVFKKNVWAALGVEAPPRRDKGSLSHSLSLF